MGKQTYTAILQHFPLGPNLSVNCKRFEVGNLDQMYLFHKTIQGWAKMPTSAFALSGSVDNAVMDTYVWEHVIAFLKLAQTGSTWLDLVLRHASERLGVCIMTRKTCRRPNLC